jgi:hypothetical protein
MAGVTEKKTAWKRSYCWLHTKGTKAKGRDSISNEIQLAQKELLTLGWDVTMRYQGGEVSSSILSALLSRVCLGDEHSA